MQAPFLRSPTFLVAATFAAVGCGDAVAPPRFETALVFVSPVIRRDSFAFTSDDLILASLDGSSYVNLTQQPGSDQSPRWSPDGSRLAFIRIAPHSRVQTGIRSGQQTDLYVANVDGSPEVPVTDDLEQDLDPVWSPDGSRIAFVRTEGFPDHGSDIFIIDPDAGSDALRRVTNRPAPDYAPTWSPDGFRIAFACRAGVAFDDPDHLCVVGANGTWLDTIVADELYGPDPEWSPVSDQIAYVCTTDLGSGICVVESDGSGHTVLAGGDGPHSSPAWAPDGTRVSYIHDGDVYVVDLGDTTVRCLTEDFDLTVEGVDWSPDGESLAIAAGTYLVSQIYVQDAMDGTGVTRRIVTPIQGYSPRWRPIF
jgi:Tol biopolymer transport system component